MIQQKMEVVKDVFDTPPNVKQIFDSLLADDGMCRDPLGEAEWARQAG